MCYFMIMIPIQSYYARISRLELTHFITSIILFVLRTLTYFNMDLHDSTFFVYFIITWCVMNTQTKNTFSMYISMNKHSLDFNQ